MPDEAMFEHRLAALLRRDAATSDRPFDPDEVARALVDTRRSRPRDTRLTRQHRRRGRPMLALPIAFLLPFAVLALLSGALLFTVGQRSPSPTSVIGPFAGFVTEEVEPGVHRVLSDGTEHDLDVSRPRGIEAGPDGSIWLVDQEEDPGRRMFRLGHAGSFDADSAHAHWPDLAIEPDGTAWITGSASSKWRSGDGPQLLALRDGTPETAEPPVGYRINGVAVATDGSVFVNGFPPPGRSNSCGSPPAVWRMGDAGWHELPPPPAEVTSSGDGGSLAVGPDGQPWLAIGTFNSLGCRGDGGLYRMDGDAWALVPDVLHGTDINVGTPAIGADGTLWVYATGEEAGMVAEGAPALSREGRRLMRLADGVWDTFLASDGAPLLYASHIWGPTMDVGADGTLWVAVVGNVPTGDAFGPGGAGPCPGVRSFDGITWRTYLPGTCVSELSIAPDGRVWVSAFRTADSPSGGWQYAGSGVYVIDPQDAATGPIPPVDRLESSPTSHVEGGMP